MIVVESTKIRVNIREITRGTLFWMKYSSWEEGRSGVAVNVTDEEITVLVLDVSRGFHTHVIITAADLDAGKWQVRYSTDGMLTVTEYPEPEPEESEE